MLARAFAFVVLASLIALSAHAADYPSRPIRVIVPNAAGGAADVSARLAAAALDRALGVPLIVENRRNGLSAVESYLEVEPDGENVARDREAPAGSACRNTQRSNLCGKAREVARKRGRARS